MSTNNEIAGKYNLKAQGAWLLFAKLVGFVFAFVLPLIVVRKLDVDEFGVYRQAFIVLMNAVAILPIGFAMSAFYFLARDESKRSAAVFNIVLVNFVVGLFAFLVLYFFPQILGTIFNSSEMTRLAPIIGLAIWLWLFSMFLETVAVANQESVVATIFIVFAQFSKTALMVGAVIWFETVDSILYAAVIQGAIQTAILLVFLGKRFGKYWKTFNFSFFREHLVYAVPFGFAGILWTLQTDIHYYFVGNRFGETVLAIYTVGCFQLPLVSMVAESVTSVLIPKMSELQTRDDRREMIRITAKAMQKLAFFYFPIFVFLLITAETFIVTLFTEKYVESIPIFLTFLFLLPFHVPVTDPIARAYEELGAFLLKVRVFTFIQLLIALYIGVQYFEPVGIITIVVVFRIVESLFIELMILRKIGTKIGDIVLMKGVGKTAVTSVIAGVPTYFVYNFANKEMVESGGYLFGSFLLDHNELIEGFVSGVLILGLSFLVFLIVYLLGANFFDLVEDDEKQMIFALLKKTKKMFFPSSY